MPGTGPGGRITDDDVWAAAAPPAAVPGTSVPLTGMRAAIACRTYESLRSSAQFTLITTADVTELVAYHEGLAAQVGLTTPWCGARPSR